MTRGRHAKEGKALFDLFLEEHAVDERFCAG